MIDQVIDLSHWNDVDGVAREVDILTVVQGGTLGVIHKATEGTSYVDPTYHERARQAVGLGLLWGAYHFLSPGDMSAQAAHFVSTVGADCPLLAADHEDADVSLADLKDFLAAVLSLTGKRAVIYSGHVIKDQLGDAHDAELAKHRLWIAQYASTPTWPSATWPQWWLWQYTDAGTVDGVVGSVDRDRFDGTARDLASEWDGGLEPPAPPKPDDKIVTITIDVPAGVTVDIVQHMGD